MAALAPFMIVPWLPKRRFGALPYMHTPRKKIDRLFGELLPRHASSTPGAGAGAGARRPPKRFIDLGSGMGEAVIEAKRRGYEARGVELNPTLFLLSTFNALVQAGPLAFLQQPRLGFALRNMWHVDLHNYDVIMVFGVQSLMARLTAKLRDEAKDGAVVVLYRFHLELPAADEEAASFSAGKGGEGPARAGSTAACLEEDEEEKELTAGTASSGGAVIRLEEAVDELSVYKVYRDGRGSSSDKGSK